MAEKILVALKRGDCAGEIAPYIEEVAKPSTKVVFLMRYPVTNPMEFMEFSQAYGAAVESGVQAQAAMAMRALGVAYSWEKQVRLAGQKVFPACEGLRKMGVEIEIDIYENSLKKAVQLHTKKGGVQLIMTRPGIGLRIINFLPETVSLFGFLNRANVSPVLLFHPNPQV